MRHRDVPTGEGGLAICNEPITPETLRSAAASIQRVLDGSTCLEDWASAFSQVLKLSGRGPSGEAAPSIAIRAARREYEETLRKWHEQLPRLQGWLIAERNRLESRLSHGAGI